MDWMGDRLARLIEDGKKALGKEVVVMSEAQEDEEDDGSGNWEEEANPGTSSGRASRSGSIRRKDKSQDPRLHHHTCRHSLHHPRRRPRGVSSSRLRSPPIPLLRSPFLVVPPTLLLLTPCVASQLSWRRVSVAKS
jgi:hypothetical protein